MRPVGEVVEEEGGVSVGGGWLRGEWEGAGVFVEGEDVMVFAPCWFWDDER